VHIKDTTFGAYLSMVLKNTLRKVDKKSHESFETWRCRRMEIISTDLVRSTEV